MANPASLTTLDAAMKEYYTARAVEDMVYANNPFLGLIRKNPNFVGDSMPVPIQHGVPQGRSATISTANTNKYAGLYKRFLLTRVSDYALADIGREVILASKNDKGAFLRAATREINGAIKSVTRSLAVSMYRSSGGAIGQVGSISTTTLTLLDINDVTNFEVGMELKGDTVDGGGTVHSGSATVTAINRETGVLTTDSNWTAQISSLAANDYLFVEGDYDLKLSGLLDWLPTTAPTSGDSFFGVDRSVDPVRLAGVRYDASSSGNNDPIEEAFTQAAYELGKQGDGVPTHCFVNFAKYADLEVALGNRARYEMVQAQSTEGGPIADIGYKSIVVSGPAGPIQIIPDRNCPSAYGFMLDLSSWELASLEPAPHLFEEPDGLRVLRNSAADSYEVRAGYYAQLSCEAPGYNSVITLP